LQVSLLLQDDADGNAAANGDPGWEPLCETPPFSEYNSTHAAPAAAAAGVLALELGESAFVYGDEPKRCEPTI
jgi:hypothetical protein